MEILAFLLSPIVRAMSWILECYQGFFASTGLSIILLSWSFSLMLFPFQRWGSRVEKRISGKIHQIDAEVRPFKKELKGEALFLETERIYKKYSYHPIYSIGLGASILVMLPVLLSAIVLFSGDGILSGERFWVISDLSKPDGLLGPVNLLPLLMFAVTSVDAKLRFKDDKRSRYRFYGISLVLLIIVYDLPAGLVLYWIASNIASLLLNRLTLRRA